MIERLDELVNANERLVHRGRFLNCRFLLCVGDTEWLVRILDGRVVEVLKGPFVMPNWVFALRASSDAWSGFWAENPKPGYHDLFAMIRFKRLRVEGDLHPFMANLFYFKAMLASLRGNA